jgi:probable O-glycosylation ligase (exosortase A-associated)
MTASSVRHRLPVQKKMSRAEPRTGSAGEDSLFAGVHWSPTYVAFIVYVFVIVTYQVKLGTESMLVALVLLPLERTPLRFPAPMIWMTALLGWTFIGWGNTLYPTVVWDSVTEFAKVCGIVFVAINVLTSRARIRFFILAFLGFFAFYPVRGALFSYFIYHGATQGRAAWNYIYSNPNDLGAFCLVPLAFSAGMLATERRTWIRYCAIAGVLSLPFVILLTQSRGAAIALGVFGLVALRRQNHRRGAILLAAATTAVIVYFVAPESMWKRLGTFQDATDTKSFAEKDAQNSAQQRLELWRVARTIAVENPLAGVGLGAYQDAHYVYSQRPTFDPIALGHRDAHSTYLTLLAETGVVGFGLFTLLVAGIVRDAERTRRLARTSFPSRAMQITYLEVGLLGYFIAGIWGSYQMMVFTYLYLAVMFVTSRALKEDLALQSIRSVHSPRALPVARRFGRRVTV